MAQILASEEVPEHDPVDYHVRMGWLDGSVPRTIPGPALTYTVGDVEYFWSDRTVQAELRYVTEHAYMWVEVGASFDQAALAGAAERFENEIYPTVRDYFGEEWSPGVDNDPHISILHYLADPGDAMGWFGSTDELPTQVRVQSNQREMFYVNLNHAVIGSDRHLSTLAHEFQHMVQWNNAGNESHALNEGLSQLAERLAGFDMETSHHAFLQESRTQLNAWAEDPEDETRYYGANYLFALYLWERLGGDFIRALSRHPGEGLASVTATLAEQGLELTVDDLFADWVVANYLDDPALADGRYGYQFETLDPICPRKRYTTLPVQESRAIPQYAAEYIEFEGRGEISIDFQGATEAALIPSQAHSGHSFWWSNRGDGAEMSLTRAFDLSDLEEPTLQFWMWYDMYDLDETDDELCLLVSTDGGETWDITLNHPALDLACYTGRSGGASQPTWVMEEIDLSLDVGPEVLVRFDYVTASFSGRPGFAVDDIAIPELGYTYDAEAGDDGWEGAGFVRTSNVVPQAWALHLVTLGDQVTVRQLDVAPDGTAHADVALGDGVDKAVLIVGAMAPSTEEEARYDLQITGGLAGEQAFVPVDGDVLLRDDFGDVCSGWGFHSDARAARGYADGGYFLEVLAPHSAVSARPGQDLADVVIDVDTTQETSAVDNTWGVLCRAQDRRNQYSFFVSSNGQYSIQVCTDGQYTPLVDWAESSMINRGPGAGNHLTVTCDGDLLSLAVNGQVLAQVRDSTFTRGDVGMTASAHTQGGARVLFHDFVVRQP